MTGFLLFCLQNLDIGNNQADAYGHMLAAAAAVASRGASEAVTSVNPHSPNSATLAGVASSNSRPGSAHQMVQHRRDSEHEQQHPDVKSSEHQELDHKRLSPGNSVGGAPSQGQYLGQNNSVLITNYGDGGAQGAVEEHFQRALNYNSGTGSGGAGDTNASGEKGRTCGKTNFCQLKLSQHRLVSAVKG